MEAWPHLYSYRLDDYDSRRYHSLAIWNVLGTMMIMKKDKQDTLETVVDSALGATSGAALGAVSSGIAYAVTGGALGLAVPVLGSIAGATMGGIIGFTAAHHHKSEKKK